MERIDASGIMDRATFHDVFAEARGFPDFSERNMDACIDCMTHLDGPDAKLWTVCAKPGEVLPLVIENAPELKGRCPEQFGR